MAQLLDTTVNGDLEVTGNVSSSAPIRSSHVVNKGYLEEVNAIYEKLLTPISGNSNGMGSWKKFCSEDYNVELKKGKYLICFSAGFSSSGSGYITTRLMNNGEEIDPHFHPTRQTVPCATASSENFWSNANSSFVFTLDSDANCSFRPEAHGTVTWTGRYAKLSIIRLL